MMHAGRDVLRAACLAVTLGGAAACGPGVGEPLTPYDLPPVVSGGIGETIEYNSAALTVMVEAIDDVDDEIVSKVEEGIVFGYYSKLSECERGSEGWESSGLEGTVVVEFTLEPGGIVTGAQPVLTEGMATDPFASCLALAIEGAALDGVELEGPAVFHMMLRYGK